MEWYLVVLLITAVIMGLGLLLIISRKTGDYAAEKAVSRITGIKGKYKYK